jgi:hypothetical protein
LTFDFGRFPCCPPQVSTTAGSPRSPLSIPHLGRTLSASDRRRFGPPEPPSAPVLGANRGRR